MSLAKNNALDEISWELNPRLLRMMNDATRMEAAQRTKPGPTAFTTRFLVQATFPHSDPGIHYFERGTEWLKLSISAPPHIGVPYGSLPRLLLAWICTVNRPGFSRHSPGSLRNAFQTLPVTADC